MLKRIYIVLFPIILSSCATPMPNDVNNICSIFRQYPSWYWATQDTKARWGVPIPVQMAIMHQESRFNAIAKPPRTKLLWIIPWKRPSTAYGYTQALATTWDDYKKKSGYYFVARDDFEDATDFIGWYAYNAKRKANINPDDAYSLYLAYHEGAGGYIRKTYLKKPWLVRVARKVKAKSISYASQLRSCHRYLRKKPWYRIW